MHAPGGEDAIDAAIGDVERMTDELAGRERSSLAGSHPALEWLSLRRDGESVALIAHRAGVSVAAVARATDPFGPFPRPSRQLGRVVVDEADTDPGEHGVAVTGPHRLLGDQLGHAGYVRHDLRPQPTGGATTHRERTIGGDAGRLRGLRPAGGRQRRPPRPPLRRAPGPAGVAPGRRRATRPPHPQHEGPGRGRGPVSYTHLTLPTINSL